MTSKKTHQKKAAIEASLLEYDKLYEAFAQNQWQETNTQAIESSNAYVNKNGLPLAKYRLKLTK
jgi:post-segregation antitoxin (ccd killing protein)